MKRSYSRSLRLAVVACTVVSTIGCAGYQIGSRSLFRNDVQTIHVPIFKSDTLRRNLGEWLTEAVVKEIEQQSHYKVVAAVDADSLLSGRVLSETKHVLAENLNDEPRNLDVNLYVEVEWRDRAGNALMQRVSIALPSAAVSVNEKSNFIPEAGQSMVTAQQEAIRAIARRVVQEMEYTPL
ncbi:MAG: LPS assembly lipoprotein LptE [Pirellulaceae bacterium]|jgi:hypothetical protein|nr:LPS assembly lipoprotein LptE [Pirellulaceae bacterium]MDP7016326.1 LPS assembly lipoprotein LptE [Pirellulaceae bacterium]